MYNRRCADHMNLRSIICGRSICNITLSHLQIYGLGCHVELQYYRTGAVSCRRGGGVSGGVVAKSCSFVVVRSERHHLPSWLRLLASAHNTCWSLKEKKQNRDRKGAYQYDLTEPLRLFSPTTIGLVPSPPPMFVT